MKKDEIKILLAENDITIKRLAAIIKMPYHRLYYALNNPNETVDIDLETYVIIRSGLEQKGLVDYPKLSCQTVSSTAFDLNFKINKELAILNKTLEQIVSDNEITNEEVISLVDTYKRTSKNINTYLNKIIEGVK